MKHLARIEPTCVTTGLFLERILLIVEGGGEKLTLKPKSMQIEKVPETGDTETWANFNKRLNDLADQGYGVSCATDTYILLSRKAAAVRREE